MRKAVPVLSFALVLACAGSVVDAKEYFQQFVHYTIQVRLDTDRHMLYGTETIFYRNNSPDTLREFYLHLYPNAYKDKNTT